MRKRAALLAVVAAVACVVIPGCAGLADWLDELEDDSVECAKDAQAEFRRCMAETAQGPAPPPPDPGLVYLP